MNLKRGLFRLWLLGSGIWLAGWFIFIWATCELKQYPGSGDKPWEAYVQICYTGFSSWMTQVRNFTVWDYASIVGSGLAVPVAALVIGLGVLWVKDGFKSRPKNSN